MKHVAAEERITLATSRKEVRMGKNRGTLSRKTETAQDMLDDFKLRAGEEPSLSSRHGR